jgi:hypothetical protein
MRKYDDPDYYVFSPDAYGYIDLAAIDCIFWINPKGEIITLWNASKIVEVLFNMGYDNIEILNELFPPLPLPKSGAMPMKTDIHPWLDINFAVTICEGE